MDYQTLNDSVIKLHDIARELQRALGGPTPLIEAIRKNADDLAEVTDALSRL